MRRRTRKRIPFRSASVMEGANSSNSLAEKRIAVVTGGNKGIGLEICRQLALNGVKVILTARDEKRGTAAVEKLRDSGLSDVVFHQLDVTDSSSMASLADFIGVRFGKLDILVNNAGIGGLTADSEHIPKILKASNEEKFEDPDVIPTWMKENLQQTYERAEECLKTNYHGVKGVTEALLPHLQLSYSGTMVNVSSSLGKLKRIPNESLRQELNDIDGLSEDRLTELSNLLLKDFKEGLLGANNWPTFVSAYIVSKVLVNCYTRILAKRYPSLCINCVCPGYVKTDINFNTGILTTEEGAKGPVMLALLPKGSSSGLFFDQTTVSTF